MGKKPGSKSKRNARSRRSGSTSGAAARWFATVLAIAGVATFLYSIRRPEPSSSASTVAQVQRHEGPKRPFFANPEDARPFPSTLEPSRFGIPFVVKAYEIARQIPEVLVQQPCDCNCGILGHRSLLDCYASRHAANCSACLQEAVFADQMTAAGRTPPEIRADIDKGLWRTVDLTASAP